MVKVPNNYHLFSVHKFDNTVNNPETPDHNAPVIPGTNTYDEMFLTVIFLPIIYQVMKT